MDQLDALYDAAIAGDVDAIAKLEMEADKLDIYDKTILHIESKKGNAERVGFILREFANKNLLAKLTTYKQTALHKAIYSGHTKVAEVIIEAARRHLPENSFQAFLRQGDKDNDTALHAAVMEENIAIVKLLVEADPTDRHTQNNDGCTPMYIAVDDGYNDIVEIISTTCLAPSLDGPDGSTAVRINNLDQVESSGGALYKIMDRDALYAAAIAGDADAIAKLEMKADILNDDDETILHVESQNGNAERVRFILREFASNILLAKLTPQKCTALHLAIYRGHTEVAEVIIDAARRNLTETSFQAFLRQGDEYMYTALHAAVTRRNVAIVKLLVEADPTDPHIQSNYGYTPMYIAVENGLNDIVEIISTTCTAPSLDGPDGFTALRINNLDQVESPGGALYKIVDRDALYAAAIAGDAVAIAELGEKANKLYLCGETILHIESRGGNTERVRFILGEFANRNLLVKLDTFDKRTALHLAAYFGRVEVAEVLIDAARRLASSSPNDSTPDNPVISFQAFLRQGDKDMNTALHLAVISGHVAIVKLLVEADPIDRHAQNNLGKTPIFIAAEEGYADIVKVICTTCTAPLNLHGPVGRHTALQAALRNRNNGIEVFEVLIDTARRHLLVTSFQAFLRHGDGDMETALHVAVIIGEVATVKLLVEADPTDRHSQNNRGKTPIYIAVEKRYTDIVKVICTTCTAPLNLDGPGGTTALHAADGIELVEVLLDTARRFPSASDNENTGSIPVSSFQSLLRRVDEGFWNSALHVAVMQGNLATAKLLVQADPTYPGIQNNKGQTPFFIAVEGGYTDIVKMMCTTCTAPFSLRGPCGWLPALHAVIKNLDEAKNEVRDVIKTILDLVKGWLFSENEDILVYLYKEFANDLFSETDEHRQNVLELAVERNYLELVELISDIPDPLYKGGWIADDFVSLIPLIYKAKDKEYKDMVKVLTEWYEAGATYTDKYSYQANRANRANQANMISAIRRHQTESASYLLRYYAPNLVLFADKLGWTILHHAAYNEFNSIITPIVEAQKRFGHRFEYQDMVSTPFHVAAQKGYTYTVILLMQLWPSSSSAYTAVDKKGQNILHLAALQSKKEMIQGILKHCPEEHKKKFVNQQDKDGHTPLHLLIKGGCFVAQLLTYEGLDTKVENNNRWTPPEMLYVDDQIIGDDQVKIKIALDHILLDQKRDIFSSPVLSITKREKKDVLFIERAKQMIYEKYARMTESTHATANCFADAIAGDPISRAALEMDADTLQEEGKTILHVESMRGVTERVEYIVREFANKNLLVKPDTLKQTALHLAAHHGHTQVVKVLIDAARHLPSSSANTVSSFHAFIRQANGQMGNTALHIAVLNCNVAIVKLLVDADPNDSHVQNNEGRTPIYIAAEKGYKNIVKEICTTCTALSLDGPGGRTTALHALIHNIHQATEENRHAIRMIINAAKHSSSAVNAPHLSFEAIFRRSDESGRTVLELAVEKSNVHVVEILLRQDPAYESGRGSKNHLMHLIYKAIDEELGIEIVKLLSEAYETGIDKVHKGVIDLILAIKGRDKELVLQLLQSKEKLVTFADDEGWTPLHYAAYHQFVSVFEVIIKALNSEFLYSHSTPFHVAAENEYNYTMTELMKLWPNSSSAYIATNKTGQNVLHMAAARKNTKMIQELLVCCPQVHRKQFLEQKDQDGNTPLHLLISNKCYVPELIKYKGLDLMAKNNKRWTPRDMLYLEDGITDDQVQIKVALDHAQTNQQWKFWKVWKFWRKGTGKGTEKDRDIFESIVLPDRRERKNVLLNKRRNEMMDEKIAKMRKDVETYKDRTNTQIVVAALITTVTFTVGFTMPGGLHQSGEVNEGLVVLSKKTAFNAFMVTDALALLLSTSSLFFYFLQSIYKDHHQVATLNAAATGLNIVSITAMMVTFITGTYVVLYHSPALAITVCIIASLFFILVIVLLIKLVYDRGVKSNED